MIAVYHGLSLACLAQPDISIFLQTISELLFIFANLGTSDIALSPAKYQIG